MPKELTEKYDIRIVPISLIINGNVYRDGVDITPAGIYKLLETSKSVPTTSSPSPGDFVQVYRELGKPVHVNIMHANVADEAEALRGRVQSQFKCVELYITDFAPTMGVQAGPGILALAFYDQEDGDVG